MALSDELSGETTATFSGGFDITQGRVIPAIADIPLGKNGRQLRLVSLFVDIRKSTQLVDAIGVEPAARMYKAYLRGISKIARTRGGYVLSFNGDGIVCGFVGANAENAAVLTALNISYFCRHILAPHVNARLLLSPLVFDFGIGIEVGDVLVVRGGIRGEENSDLVWAGKAVNYSVKIASLASEPFVTYMSDQVMDSVDPRLYYYRDGQKMWEAWYWTDKTQILWRSNWWVGTEYLTSVPGQLPALPAPSRT